MTPDALFVPFGSYYSLPPDLPTTSRNQWNLSIQRQFAGDLTVETTYIGSQAAHIWYNNAINYGLFVSGDGDANGNCMYNGQVAPFTVRPGRECSSTRNLNDRRRLNILYPNIGGTTLSYVDEYTNGGTQSYHGLLVSVQRRAADGVSFGSNYTFSHCYGDDNVSQSGHGGNPDRTVRPGDRAADRGNCRHDRRHVFNLTSVLQTPEFANPTVRALASDWSLSTIFRRSSGAFLTADMGRRRDQARSGVADQRANQVLDDVFLDKSGDPGSVYLNRAAFDLPAVGTYGNIGPRNIKGIGAWDFDVALARTFQLGETQQLEFRAEAYNVTNSFRPVNPEDNIRSRNFGRIRRSEEPRILQFALKWAF